MTEPKPDRVESAKKSVERRTVTAKATGGYTLPSGSQFLLQPGVPLDLTDKDAQFLIDNDLAE